MTNLPKAVPLYSEEIDHRWRASLMMFFLRRVHDRLEAEDLTQETFARSVGRTSRNKQTNIGSYLFAVGANLLRDRARRAVTHHTKSHESLYDHQFDFEFVAAEDHEPERVLIGKETLREVLNALGELDERTRNIFILSRLEKMKQTQIAELYGISVSAVEKQVIKATTHLATRVARNG